MMKQRLKIAAMYYLPVLLWSGMIFYFSSIPDLKVGAAQVSGEISLRKMAHISEFAILAWLMYRILFVAHGVGHKKTLVYSLLSVLLFSISDEVHQTFVGGRAGKAVDVVIDGLGATLGLQLSTIYYRKQMKKLTILGILAVLAILGGIMYQMVVEGRRQELARLQQPMEASEIGKVEIEQEPAQEEEPEDKQGTASAEEPATPEQAGQQQESPSAPAKTDLPKKVKVSVPFTSQAPYANWDAVHEDACEEASLIMVWAFLNKQSLTQEKAEKEIQDLAAYQTKQYGDYIDSDMKEVVDIARDHYKITSLKVVYDFTLQDLKAELAEGKPVILPTAGRRLGNPNFKTPGPLYHNLVAIGYDGKNIITNDPGTRNGRDFVYNEDVLFSAIHDFPGKKENIEQGRKAMIVIE